MKIEIPPQDQVVSFYGEEIQSLVHAEELAELIQAISKMRRIRGGHIQGDDGSAYYNLVEEMADCLVCMDQLKLMYGITDHEIQLMVDRKCRRQEDRMREAQKREGKANGNV